MTDWTMQSTEDDPRLLLGRFVSARTSSAKDLAQRIGCDVRSAESYRAGRYWPPARLWPAIIAAFGQDVTDAVFHPAETKARLAQQIAARKAELRALERDFHALPGDGAGDRHGVGTAPAAARPPPA